MEFVPRFVWADFAAVEKGVAQWKGAAISCGRGKTPIKWLTSYQSPPSLS